MRKSFMVFSAMACVAFGVQAQVEKFPGEASKQIGAAPVKEGEEGGSNYQIFAYNGLALKVFYVGGKSSRIEAWKTEEVGGIVKYVSLSEKEIESVLKLNADGAKWLEAPPAAGVTDLKKWMRDDNKANAEYSGARKILVVSAGAAGAARASSSSAQGGAKDWTPVQFSLTPGRNWPAKPKCYGLKLGLISGGGYLAGVEGALVACRTEECDGIQGAFYNSSETFNGIQGAMVNVSRQFQGAQFAVVNLLQDATPTQPVPEGAQFGLVNYTKKMYGFQFGLVNIIEDGMIPFMPFINFNTEPK